jgi:hypothetical protein
MLWLVEGRKADGDDDVSLTVLMSEFDRIFMLLKHTDLEFAWQVRKLEPEPLCLFNVRV